MDMKMRQISYGAPAKQILAIPDHYIALAFEHAKATVSTPGLAVLEDGKYIVKAGTIYPANDATAIGVILNDYDVTYGGASMAVVVHGLIKTAALPSVPVADAITAMNQIKFVPIGTTIVVDFVDSATTVLTYTEGATTATSRTVNVKLTDGLTFNAIGAIVEANWTITGEATTKVSVDSIALSADRTTATFTLVTTTTALVAGDITVVPLAAAVSVGKVPATAITIATVA